MYCCNNAAIPDKFSWDTLYVANISLFAALFFPLNVFSCYFIIKSYKPTLGQAGKKTTVPSNISAIVVLQYIRH